VCSSDLRIRIVAIPVQFRTVAAAFAAGLEAAVTVADDLPAGIRREPMLTTKSPRLERKKSFTCLYDPRHARVRSLSMEEYFAHEHIIVSYNGDLRGIVEDEVGRTRNIRCSVSSFAHVGALIDGTSMLATVPNLVADQILRVRPHLKTKALPFSLQGAFSELLWPVATDDDEPCRFVRSKILEIARSNRGAD